MWRQRAEQRLEAAAAVEEMSGFLEETGPGYEEERCRLKDKMQRYKILDAVFNPRVCLHRLVFPADVQQTVLIKEEAPEEWRPGVDQQDPETPIIKEEEEELWTSLDVEQLNVKVEADDTFTEVPLKSEYDEEKPVFSQLHQHQVEDGDPPTGSSADQIKAAVDDEDCGGAKTTWNLDNNTYEDDFSSSETEVSEDDEDVNDPDPQLKDLSNSGSEPEDGDKDLKESRAPESGVNTVNKSCSFSECGRQFLLKKSGISSKKIQSKQKSFSCGVCGKRFTREYLTAHMRIHTGEKPFSCDVCGHRFAQKSTLNRHMKIHTGQKPFPCNVCGRAFRDKSTVNAHMRIHTGQKPYACDVCGHRFAQKSTLNTHMKIHTGQKPFPCDVCGPRFLRKSTVNTHMRIHTRGKNSLFVNIKSAPQDT